MSDDALSIGFVLCPGMLVTGTALPYEMWQAAADYGRAHQRGRRLRPWLVAADRGARHGRLPLAAEVDLADCPSLDVLYLPALWRNPRQALRGSPGLAAWLVRQHASGTRIAAVGTGVSLLAASGLLDGRAATTHWYSFDRFERDYPRVALKRRFFITQSGTLYCAASINSLADVSVHLIELTFGRDTARHVERNFSHEIRRSYEDYRFLEGGPAPLDDELVAEVQAYIGANVARDLGVRELAAGFGVSARTLERRFRAAIGCGPRAWWQRERVRLAQDLLARTNLGIGEVAARVGYQDAGFFARLFQREFSLTPLAYRTTVRAKLFRPLADGRERVVNPIDTGGPGKISNPDSRL